MKRKNEEKISAEYTKNLTHRNKELTTVLDTAYKIYAMIFRGKLEKEVEEKNPTKQSGRVQKRKGNPSF